MAEVPTRRAGVQSLDRAVQILQTFDTEHPVRGVSEIARLVGLTPSTTHRLLASLQAHALVRKAGDGTRYALGPELLRLAQVARGTMNLAELARPTMVWLRDQTDETVALHVADATPQRVVLDQVESRQPLRRTYTEVGQPVPIHEGGPGKVLLAFHPPEVQEAVLSRPLEKATPNTINQPEQLREELRKVREQDHAMSYEERIPGISTVAVPVRDHSRAVAAALSVSGPSSRMTPERLHEILPLARSAAREIGRILGYTDDVPTGDLGIEGGEQASA
jgi:IclR family transcriptional regulator, acetate operon repressor